jgi:glucose-6-phosphate dehydrogenase assembly protein OpcA
LIEKELEKLFLEQKNKKQLKSFLFTLIIYSSEKRRTAELRDSVQAIVNKFPCRILFIESTDEKNNAFSVSLSAPMNGAVSSDQIDIVCSKERLNEVPFLILPHFVPDLPIYLLWGGDPTEENPLLLSLIKYIDRLIFDSEEITNLHRFSVKLLEEMKAVSFEWIDIEWVLLKGWRRALEAVFDTKERILNLYDLKEIHIFYTEPKERQSVYLASWILSILDLKISKMETLDNVRILHTKTTTVFLHPERRKEAPGTIFAITMSTVRGESYSLRKQEGQAKIVVHVSNQERCEMPFSLPLTDLHKGLTFINEVFFLGSSSHYQKMLSYVQTLPF